MLPEPIDKLLETQKEVWESLWDQFDIGMEVNGMAGKRHPGLGAVAGHHSKR